WAGGGRRGGGAGRAGPRRGRHQRRHLGRDLLRRAGATAERNQDRRRGGDTAGDVQHPPDEVPARQIAVLVVLDELVDEVALEVVHVEPPLLGSATARACGPASQRGGGCTVALSRRVPPRWSGPSLPSATVRGIRCATSGKRQTCSELRIACSAL